MILFTDSTSISYVAKRIVRRISLLRLQIQCDFPKVVCQHKTSTYRLTKSPTSLPFQENTGDSQSLNQLSNIQTDHYLSPPGLDNCLLGMPGFDACLPGLCLVGDLGLPVNLGRPTPSLVAELLCPAAARFFTTSES